MAYTEETVVDKIEVLEDGLLQVRQVTRFYRDGQLIATSPPHRSIVKPGDDIPAGSDQLLRDVKGSVHTQARTDAFNARRQNQGRGQGR